MSSAHDDLESERTVSPDPPDAEELGQLFERYLPGLRAFVRLRAGDVLRARESSSDVVQSTCREVLAHMDRFRHRGEGAFKHWLYRTAERKIIDRLRYHSAGKRDVGQERSLAGHSSAQDDSRLLTCYATFHTPSRDAAVREQLERIEHAFDQLSEDYQEVFVLSRIVGLSHKEIAAEMGRTEGAVRILLYRALARLSELVA